MFVLGQALQKGVPMVYGSSTAMMISEPPFLASVPELAFDQCLCRAKLAQFYKASQLGRRRLVRQQCVDAQAAHEATLIAICP